VKLYPISLIVDFSEWYEHKYGRNDILLALVANGILFTWVLLYLLITGKL